jgi:trehalose-6-phosphate synthase
VPSSPVKSNIQQERLMPMKTITTVLFLAAAVTALGQTTQPPVNVRISTEVEELARGYAAAFSGMTHTPIYLIHSRDDNTTVLVSLRSVKAVAGVLIVQDEKGLTYVLNPRDVVMITDAPPKKEM